MDITSRLKTILKPYTALKPKDSLSDAVEWLLGHKKTLVPVVDNHRLIGVVKESNLFANLNVWDDLSSITVATVMDTDCPLIPITSDVSEAFILISSANSRYVVATNEDGTYAGILYEEDCIGYFSSENLMGNNSVEMIMRSGFLQVQMNDSLKDVLQSIHNKRFGSVLIYEKDICRGIFTDYDVLKLSKAGKAVLDRPIFEFMHFPIISINANDSIANAQSLIETHTIHHLLVENSDKTPIGIVSQHDIASGISGTYFHLLRQTITQQAKKIQSQQEKLQKNEMLNNIIEAFPNSMMIAFDASGSIFFRTNTLFKQSNCAEIGDNLFDHLNEPLLHLVAKEHKSNFIGCEQGCEEDFFIQLYENKYEIKAMLLPINDHKAIPIGYLLIIQDQTEKKKAEKNLNLAQYSLDHAAIGVYWIDPKNSAIFYANDNACKALGYTQEELTHLKVIDIDPNFNPKKWEDHSHELEKVNSKILYTQHQRKDGSIFPVEVHANLTEYEGKLYNLAFAIDITERQAMSQQLELSNYCIDVASLSIFWANIDGKIIYMNQTATEQLGYTKAERLMLSVYDLDPLTTPAVWAENVKNLESLKHAHFESVHQRKNGSTFPVELFVNYIEHYGQKLVVGFAYDISEKKKAVEQIDYMSTHDSLTGLPNRNLLDARLEHSLQVCERAGKKTAVCFIDLDNFKYINEALSHVAGDEILQETAHRLSKQVRKYDTVARFGSDEFVIILQAIDDLQEIMMILNEILKSIQKPFSTSSGFVNLGASIGVSLYPDDALSKETLIKYADVAMHRAKADGRNRIEFYTDELMRIIQEKLHIQTLLREAISLKQFVLYYQPQIDLQSMEIIGFEALVRWNHPRMGFIPPDKFISAAEENKLIIPLGEWILEEACSQMAQWKSRGIFDGVMAVNASGVQLEHEDFSSIVTATLAKTGVSAKNLEIEITESSLMNNPKQWLEVLHKIDALGVKLAIDDFGTGYSSLSYLRQMPVHVLKIDQSFVFDLPADLDACVIAEAITGLAKNMNMLSLAEGIETVAHMVFLQQIGCKVGQGYLFSKPMSAVDAEAFIQNWNPKNFIQKTHELPKKELL